LGIRRTLLVTWSALCGAAAMAYPAAADGGAPALSRYFSTLDQKGLAPRAGSIEEFRAELSRAELLALEGRHEAAALILYELVESPRFSDYTEVDDFDAARFALGSSLHHVGAETSARAYLRLVIDKGPDARYFAPSFRRYADIVLAQRDLNATVVELRALPFTLPEDASDELRYLEGRERFDAGDDAAASDLLSRVGPRSRFYANAQYLQGALAARSRKFLVAERHFCKVASPKDDSRFAFRVDQRYFHVKDLARLGLGRIAHEQGRSDDAFYYYFQVPSDSAELPHAMFEAAYAMYEGGDHENALDLLDQLEARFPGSALADEAALLRGYAALSGCEFEKARQMFTRFIDRFGPVLDEVDRIAASPARREALYAELVHVQTAPQDAPRAQRSLLGLLRVDPAFAEEHARLRKLDAEVARSSRVSDQLELIAARLAGSERPRANAPGSPSAADELLALRQELRDGRHALQVLTAQLDTMAGLGAARAELAPIEADVSKLAGRLRELQDRVEQARAEDLEQARASTTGLEPLLAADLQQAARFDVRAVALRGQLVRSANMHALRALTELRERLSRYLRRARIGRIDAIMGSKRRIEQQIETLSAGKLPAGMQDPLQVQGFLADDEEYWPFEGEDWPDEFEEHYDAPAEKAGKP
jgi:Outer membrane lipoprotein